jgi:hypothetical protein
LRHPEILRWGQRLLVPPAEFVAAAGHEIRAEKMGARKGKEPPAEEAFSKRSNPSYGVGEKLTFAVQYFGVTAGLATLSVQDYALQSGRPTLHVVAEAKTHPFFDHFFRVRDRVETFIDLAAQMPWRYEKHLQEGKFRSDSFFLYDQRQHLLVDDRGKNVAVPPQVQDVISCFYYYRTLDLQPGAETWIPVAADDMKNYELEVKALRRERVKVLAGTFDCLVVQPFMKFQGVFQQKGEVFVWLSDDARHLPVMIKSRIVIGTIDIVLQDAQTVQAPLQSAGKVP